MSHRSRLVAAALATIAFQAAVACSIDSGVSSIRATEVTGPADDTDPATAGPTTTTDAPAPTASETASTPEANVALNAKDVLAKVGPSIVFISTEFASGTGIMLDGGYVLTNAHVITPFNAVDVTPPDGSAEVDVPVVGVDFDADLAVLGPLATAVPAAPLAASTNSFGTGDAVYLVGYPSETESSPSPAIAAGIISRLRNVDDFDQTYIQTDAAIAGGQSGGALVDEHGEVIGISGMSLDEAFALALSIEDVSERLGHLLQGGQPWQPLVDGDTTSATAKLPGFVGSAVLQLAPSTTTEQVTVTLGGFIDPTTQVGLEVYFDDGTGLTSRNWLNRYAAMDGIAVAEAESAYGADELLDITAEGSYVFEVPADARASVWLSRLDLDETLDVAVTSTRPFQLVEDTDDTAAVEIGEQRFGTIDPLEFQDVYTVDLAALQSVEITVASAVGDPSFSVLALGADFRPDTDFVDDSNLGMGGLDAQGVFTAPVAGTYRIIVWDNTDHAGYLLKLAAA